MGQKPVTPGLFKFLNATFVLANLSYWMAGSGLLRHPAARLIMLATTLIWLVAWLVTLGISARRLGRSWILWCGLSLATMPFGFFIGHVLMFRRLKAALPEQEEEPEPQGLGAHVAQAIADRRRAQSAVNQAPSDETGPRGKCPNCDALIALSAAECPKCNAQFGARSAWHVKPV